MYPVHGPCVAALAAPGFHQADLPTASRLCQTLGRTYGRVIKLATAKLQPTETGKPVAPLDLVGQKMATDGKETLVDIWLRWFKNNPFFAMIIFLGVVVGAISSSAESVKKISGIFKTPPAASAPQVPPPDAALDLDSLRAELRAAQERITTYKGKVEMWDSYLADRAAQLNRTKGAKPQTDDEIRAIVASISLQEKIVEEARTNRTQAVNDLADQVARALVLRERIAARP